MRSVSYSALFIAHAAVGIFALAAPSGAAPIFINGDTTVSADANGDPGGTAADDATGSVGGAAVIWDAVDADALFNSGLTFMGGTAGDGGLDAANDGGNDGGNAGNGFHMWEDGGTATATDIFVFGGSGGDGSNGGVGGANDTIGGAGGAAAFGIYAEGVGMGGSLTDSAVMGGDGGDGGDAGDAAGDAADNVSGGDGSDGGAGLTLFATTDADLSLNNTTVTGGNGGAGGASLANATNASGGEGGAGLVYFGTGATLTLGAGTVVAGGAGGAAGAGGTGGNAGFDGAGVLFGGLDGVLTNHGTIEGGGNGAGTALMLQGTAVLVDNHGTIGSASNHDGIALALSGEITTLHNQVGGLIQSTGANHAIYVMSTGSITDFINEGSIIASGGPNAVRLDGAVESFVNSGTIQSTASSALVLADAAAPDLIDNTDGVISNQNVANAAVTISTDLGANGVTFQGGAFVNGGGGAAIGIAAAQTGNIAVKNAEIGGGIVFGQDNETLNVSGSILAGDVVFAAGVNNLNFLFGGTTTIGADTHFMSGDTLYFSPLAGSNVISNSAQTDANSAITHLTTIANAHLTLNEDFWVDGSAFNGGTIEIAVGKTLSANDLTGAGLYVLGVTDDATLAKIEGQGTGSVLDFTDATFEIKLTNPSSLLAVGTNLLIAEDLQDNAVQGVTDGALADDNAALLNFLLYRGDAPEIGLTSDLLFVQVQLALLADIASHGDDPNAVALGGALDAIGLDGDDDIDDLMLALAQLPTDADINEVLDALLPETDGVAYEIATDAGDQVLDVASRRLDALRGVNIAAREYRIASTAPVGPPLATRPDTSGPKPSAAPSISRNATSTTATTRAPTASPSAPTPQSAAARRNSASLSVTPRPKPTGTASTTPTPTSTAISSRSTAIASSPTASTPRASSPTVGTRTTSCATTSAPSPPTTRAVPTMRASSTPASNSAAPSPPVAGSRSFRI